MRINKNAPRLRQYDSNPISMQSSCLVTGNCSPVRQRLAEELIKASQSHRAVVILDFGGEFDSLHDTLTKYSNYRYHVDYDTYAPFTGDEKQVILYIQEKAMALGYTHSETIQAINYWQLVNEINRLRGVHANSLQELVSYYYDISQIQLAVHKLVEEHVLNVKDLNYIEHQILANTKGATVIDNILTDTSFRLSHGSNFGEDGYTLKTIDSTSVVYMYVNSIRSTANTEALLQSVTEDITTLTTPVSLIINMGKVPRTPVVDKLVRLATTHSIPTLYITDDLFLDSDSPNSFRNLFEVNVIGAHNGTSAQRIQEIFPTRKVLEKHYSRTYDRRLLTTSTIDLLLGRNYQDTISHVPTETPAIRAEYVARMPPSTYLLLYTKSNTYRLGSV
jgi:hypothetical protein